MPASSACCGRGPRWCIAHEEPIAPLHNPADVQVFITLLVLFGAVLWTYILAGERNADSTLQSASPPAQTLDI